MSPKVTSPITAVTATWVVAAVLCAIAKSDLESFFGRAVMVVPGSVSLVHVLVALALLLVVYYLYRTFRSEEQEDVSFVPARGTDDDYPENPMGPILMPRVPQLGRGQPA